MKNLAFSDPMSAAEAEGRKTISRRVIPFSDPSAASLMSWNGRVATFAAVALQDDPVPLEVRSRYVFGEPVYFGEALVAGPVGTTKYRRDGATVHDWAEPIAPGSACRWRWQRNVLAPRFCPQACARRFGRIVDVRPERLHAITEQDAKLEGVTPFPYDPEGDCWTAAHPSKKHLTAFEYLWGEINGWQGAPGARAPYPTDPWVFRLAWVSISRDDAMELDRERKAAA